MIYVTARNTLAARRKDQNFQFNRQLRELKNNLASGKIKSAEQLQTKKNNIERKYVNHEKANANWVEIMNIARNMMPPGHRPRVANLGINPTNGYLKSLKKLIPVYSVKKHNFRGREGVYFNKVYRNSKVINYYGHNNRVKRSGQSNVPAIPNLTKAVKNMWARLNRARPRVTNNVRQNAPARSPNRNNKRLINLAAVSL
jgi:hypothetical protein